MKGLGLLYLGFGVYKGFGLGLECFGLRDLFRLTERVLGLLGLAD